MTNFTMEDLKKKIQEQTVVSMGMMMPEEHLKELVDEAIEKFFDPTIKFHINTNNSYSYYDSQRRSTAESLVSPFTLMVWEKLTPIVKQSIDDYFNNETEKVQKDVTDNTISEDFKVKAGESIAKLVPHMAYFQASQSTMLAMTVLKEQIRQTLGPHQIFFDVNR